MIKPLANMLIAVRDAGQRGLDRLGEAPAHRTPAAPVPPYHAVSIQPGSECCAAVVEMSQHRYLSRHARPLPLTACTQPDQCVCTFRKHADRRIGYDRRTVFLGIETADRRRSRGRRATDF